jgi:hypothetical protein
VERPAECDELWAVVVEGVVCGEWELCDGVSEEAAVAAAGGFGDEGEDGAGDGCAEEGEEGECVVVVWEEGGVAAIQQDVGAAGGEEAWCEEASDVGPGEAGQIGA